MAEYFQGQNFKQLKSKFPVLKVNLERILTRFEHSLERRDFEKVKILFHDANDKIAFLVCLIDTMELALIEEDSTTQSEEKPVISKFSEEILRVENKIAIDFEKYEDKLDIKPVISSLVTTQNNYNNDPPMIKLCGMDPPCWNGQKVDFYTWKERFTHIMHHARITDDLVQISWLLRNGAMPNDYQTMICDCKSISSAWERLEERIPKSVVQREVIKQYEQIKPLYRTSRNPANLRRLAHEISLFCRRMEDLGLKQDANSVISVNRALECLDADTALRYNSSSKGNHNLEFITNFLRSEATALEISGNFISQTENMRFRPRQNQSPRSNFNTVNHATDENDNMGSVQPHQRTVTCIFGCGIQHRLIDCNKYQNLSIPERKNFIADDRRCFICLGTHFARNCARTTADSCVNCNQRQHHWSLCPGKVQGNYNTMRNSGMNDSNLESQHIHSNAAVFNQSQMHSRQLSTFNLDYSPLLVAEVQASDKTWVKANFFLDGGSNHSLVRRNFVKSLKQKTIGHGTIRFGVAGGAIHEEPSEDYNLKIRPLSRDQIFDIRVTAVRKPCHDVTPIPPSIFKQFKYLRGIQDKIPVGQKTVDVLVGRDYAPLIQTMHSLRSPIDPDNHPSAAFTSIGCYLYGGIIQAPQRSFNHVANINSFSSLENEELRKFFHGEVLGVQPTTLCVCSNSEIAESAFIKHVKATTNIGADGRVCVKMPWKPGFPEKLHNNYEKAYEQMKKREQELYRKGKTEEYNMEIKNLLQRGVVRRLTSVETKTAKVENAWYLNHRIVERPDKTSTKLRIVFDSACPFKGTCLNDGLEKGPSFANSLFRCFMAWRADSVAIAGDISKMFNQIQMAEVDQKFHRFLWRYGDSSLQPTIFQWLRVMFGDKSSPDLACFTIKFLADKFRKDHPLGAVVLDKDTYIDDVSHSVSNHILANKVINDVDQILIRGKFSIKIWNSNHPEVDQNPGEKVVDVLGHSWNKTDDRFSSKFKDISFMQTGFSKRKALACVMKLWDPLGYLLPVTMQYRIDLQKIWADGFSWDQTLPDDVVKCWYNNVQEMSKLAQVSTPRCLKPENTTGPPQLHAFSDGGDLAYGTCVFLRWPTTGGVKLTFVAAKGFVAPLKHKSTPRKELMGAIGMSRLVHEISKALPYNIAFKYFWTDSKVVIYWLNSQSGKFKPFVASRVQEFQDTHKNLTKEVKFIPSLLNAADCLTKPISCEKLTIWHEGPAFLRQPMEYWPNDDDLKLDELRQEILEEKPPTKSKAYRGKRQFNVVKADLPYQNDNDLADNFSSWQDLLRATAWMKGAFQQKSFVNLEFKPADVVQYIEKAKLCIFRICQKSMIDEFGKAVKTLWKLDLLFDSHGILRIGGRLNRTDLYMEMKHPVVLPGKHSLVRLLGVFYHKKFLHQGYRVILANMKNDGIVLIGGRILLKSIASMCIFCRIRRRKLLQQRMGELPSFRMQPQMAPFNSVAMDFFGYLKVKQSRNVVINASVLIITCATTRCIHLELCLALDTNSFLRAWRRFVSIRGIHPAFVFSDGGTTFQASQAPIKEWIEKWNFQLIQHEMAENQTKFDWKYNVPYASHMNGVVESLINSVRKALDASVVNYSRALMTYEEWTTVLNEITYIINSRPLFPDGNPLEYNCSPSNYTRREIQSTRHAKSGGKQS
ncbi:uncharacterized protein LOC120339891 [Styela clava]